MIRIKDTNWSIHEYVTPVKGFQEKYLISNAEKKKN